MPLNKQEMLEEDLSELISCIKPYYLSCTNQEVKDKIETWINQNTANKHSNETQLKSATEFFSQIYECLKKEEYSTILNLSLPEFPQNTAYQIQTSSPSSSSLTFANSTRIGIARRAQPRIDEEQDELESSSAASSCSEIGHVATKSAGSTTVPTHSKESFTVFSGKKASSLMAPLPSSIKWPDPMTTARNPCLSEGTAAPTSLSAAASSASSAPNIHDLQREFYNELILARNKHDHELSNLMLRKNREIEDLREYYNEKMRQNEEKIQSLEIVISNFNMELNTAKTSKDQQMEKTVAKYEAELELLRQECQRKVANLAEDFDKEKREHEEQNKVKYESMNRELQSGFDSLKLEFTEKMEEHENKVGRLESELNELEIKKNSAELDLSILRRDNEEKTEKLKDMTSSMAEHLRQHDILEREFRENIEENEREIENLKQQETSRLRSLELEKSLLEQKSNESIEELKNQITELQGIIEQKRQMNNEYLQLEIERFEAEKSQLINGHKTAIESLSREMNEKLTSKSDQCHAAEINSTALETELKSCKIEYESELQKLKDNCEAKLKEKEDLCETKVKNAKEHVNNIQQRFAEDIEQRNQEIRELLNDISKEKVRNEKQISQLKIRSDEEKKRCKEELANEKERMKLLVQTEMERIRKEKDCEFRNHRKHMDSLKKMLKESQDAKTALETAMTLEKNLRKQHAARERLLFSSEMKKAIEKFQAELEETKKSLTNQNDEKLAECQKNWQNRETEMNELVNKFEIQTAEELSEKTKIIEQLKNELEQANSEFHRQLNLCEQKQLAISEEKSLEVEDLKRNMESVVQNMKENFLNENSKLRELNEFLIKNEKTLKEHYESECKRKVSDTENQLKAINSGLKTQNILLQKRIMLYEENDASTTNEPICQSKENNEEKKLLTIETCLKELFNNLQ